MLSPTDWLQRQAAARGAHAAVVVGDAAVSFAALDERVSGRAAALGTLRPTSRVGVFLENGLELIETVLACLRLGRPAVLFDARLSLEELRKLAGSTLPGVIVSAGATLDVGRALAAEIEAELHVVGDPPRVVAATSPVTADLEREAVVVFSSGTSGVPKPIALTAGNLLWSALGSAARLGAQVDERWLACLPLSHLGGLSILFRSVLFGSTMVVQSGFDVTAVRGALAEQGISMISLVPTTLRRLIEEGRCAAPHLRGALIGGASAPLDLLIRARAAGVPVVPTYGLTETASQAATLAIGAELSETGFVGAPLLPTTISIVDEQGNALPAGEVGTIRIQGATVAPGALGADGWLHTGDLGRLDDAGALTVLGRRDDVIVTGGENVSPTEVEHVLEQLPGVREVAVAAVADPEWGHVVGVWLVPSGEGPPPTVESLRVACRPHLAGHKHPRRLFLVDALPRTALGKVRRRDLAES